MQISNRPRRNRKNINIRSMIRENIVTVDDLIAPLFFIEGENNQIEINSMPGQFRFTIDRLVKEVKELQSLGIKCISLFPAIDDSLKTKNAKESYNPDGLNQRAIRAIKDSIPNMTIMTDIALDPYSSDGHDGIVSSTGEILND